jgi:hypothetical protein
MWTNIEISFGLILGLVIFLLMGVYYGIKSTDTNGKTLIILSLAANLMSFTVFGVLFTLIWLIALLTGNDLTIHDFHLALLWMICTGVTGFYLGYLTGKVVRPDHRTVR